MCSPILVTWGDVKANIYFPVAYSVKLKLKICNLLKHPSPLNSTSVESNEHMLIIKSGKENVLLAILCRSTWDSDGTIWTSLLELD